MPLDSLLRDAGRYLASRCHKTPPPAYPELYRVTISNVSCHGLLAEDIGGTSDPYVTFDFNRGEMRFKTAVARKNVSPDYTANDLWYGVSFYWRSRLPLSESSRKCLRIKVHDKDKWKFDDYLGEAKVRLHTLATGPVKHDLALRVRTKPAGRVKFHVAMELVGNVQLLLRELHFQGPSRLPIERMSLRFALQVREPGATNANRSHTGLYFQSLHIMSIPLRPRGQVGVDRRTMIAQTTHQELSEARLQLALTGERDHSQNHEEPLAMGEIYLRSLIGFPESVFNVRLVKVQESGKKKLIGKAKGVLVLEGMPMKTQMGEGIHYETGIRAETLERGPWVDSTSAPRGRADIVGLKAPTGDRELRQTMPNIMVTPPSLAGLSRMRSAPLQTLYRQKVPTPPQVPTSSAASVRSADTYRALSSPSGSPNWRQQADNVHPFPRSLRNTEAPSFSLSQQTLGNQPLPSPGPLPVSRSTPQVLVQHRPLPELPSWAKCRRPLSLAANTPPVGDSPVSGRPGPRAPQAVQPPGCSLRTFRSMPGGSGLGVREAVFPRLGKRLSLNSIYPPLSHHPEASRTVYERYGHAGHAPQSSFAPSRVPDGHGFPGARAFRPCSHHQLNALVPSEIGPTTGTDYAPNLESLNFLQAQRARPQVSRSGSMNSLPEMPGAFRRQAGRGAVPGVAPIYPPLQSDIRIPRREMPSASAV